MMQTRDYNAPTVAIPFLTLCLAVQPADAQPFRATPSLAHARAFAPPDQAERYQFLVTEAAIDLVARVYRERWPSPAPGSWAIVAGSAAEAFDAAALFDRPRLARLYGGSRPRVARGPIGAPQPTAVVLLLSPFPAADLSHLNQGTLIMVVQVPWPASESP
jgi:hypothetical protein